MLRYVRTAVALILLPGSIALSVQAPAPTARIEGTVLQAGAVVPQPVVGARVIVTRVNGTTGANLPVRGGVNAPSVAGEPGVSGVFPGMPGTMGALPQLPAGPLPTPTFVLPIPSVTTGSDGKFVVPDLEEGTYRLLITKPGYVRQEFGQRVFPGQGTPINLVAGQVARDITMNLTPTGNVSGRLVDDNGLPAVGVNLQLYKATYTVNGQRVLQSAGNARSNDRGEYRFYWITPGRYYVGGGSAAATFTFGGGASPNDPGDSYLLSYYPGVTDVNRATAVEVKSGSEMVADFVTPRQRLYTISGKVVDPNPPAANGRTPEVTLSLAFQLLTGNAGWFTMNQAYDAATGTFVMRNVLPGSYVLQAAAPPFFARVPVEVVNSNIEGIVVAVDGGVTINGRFVAENGAMPPPNTLRVQMRHLTSNGLPNYVGATPIPSPAAADGSFTISNVIQGQYRVIVPAQDFYVKEVRYDRADALNTPIEVSRRSSDVATMEVIISRNVSQVDGFIADDRGRPAAGVQAVLVPDSRGRTDLYKTATTDQSGRFVIRGVTPGDYKLFAWEALETYGYFDPDLLRRSETLGKPAHVAESSNLSVEGKIISAARLP